MSHTKGKGCGVLYPEVHPIVSNAQNKMQVGLEGIRGEIIYNNTFNLILCLWSTQTMEPRLTYFL